MLDNLVSYYTEIFQAETQANAAKRQTELEDWAFYAAIENGQYNRTATARMLARGQQPLSFNLIMKNIDTEAGMLLQQPFEFQYEADFGQKDRDATLLNELRLRDKDLGKWARQKQMFVVAGLVNTGVLEMFVDESQDEMGALNWRYRIPTDYMFDSNWRDDDINHNKQVYEYQYMDPEQIKRTYGQTAEQLDTIEVAIAVWKSNRSAMRNSIPSRFSSLELEKNGRFLVLQAMEMEWQKKIKLYNPKLGQFLRIDMPDRQARRDFIHLSAMMGESLLELPKDDLVCTVRAFAPGLSMTAKLADGPHPIQVGRYPLVVWSAYNVNGKRFGRVSQYKDPQSVFNKRIMTFLHWQMTASLGTKLIGPGAFDDDDEKQRYIEEHNIPGGAFDVLDSSKITNDQRENAPTDLIKVKDDAREIIDYIGPGLAAQGKSENDSESGLYYNAKREQSNVASEHLNTGLEFCELQMGEMYLLAAPQQYANAPRTWKSKKSGQDMFMNTDAGNDISKIGRLSVRVSQAPVGSSVKRENLAIVAKLRQTTKNPLEDSVLAIQTVDLLPGLNEEVRAKMKEDLSLINQAEVLKAKVAIVTLTMQLAQATQMAQQAMQSGMPGPGARPPGQGLPPPADAVFSHVIPQGGAIPKPGSEQPVGNPSPAGALA